ncbi:MAG: nucleotidyltransferase family protein [Magnetococcales bacterium]|nr:nucleotidyltransferase family protein [Magnetococcales bacterium]
MTLTHGTLSTPLLTLLRQPDSFPNLTLPEQDLALRLLRRAGLLAWLFYRLQEGDSWQTLHPKVRDHLEGARVVAVEDERMLRWEVNRIRRALLGTGIPVTLLKGAAYCHAGLPMARGRLVADVDLLFVRDDLDQVEQALTEHGWKQVKLNSYDQNYYRQWMHELPPMRHWERLTEVDLHHTILPITGRLKPNPALLWQDRVPVVGESGVWTLSAVDMTLHAMVHLFHDADFDRGLRDLVDLDGLFRHFAKTEPTFWASLTPRARQLGLGRPLFHALTHLNSLMQTPIPQAVLIDSQKDGPIWPLRPLMGLLIPLAILPGHPERANLLRILAWWPLYLRSHWLKMPPTLLFSHLTHKLSRRWRPTVQNRRLV